MKEYNAPRHVAEIFNLLKLHMEADIHWAKEALKKINAHQLP
jgi:hypothetical protein